MTLLQLVTIVLVAADIEMRWGVARYGDAERDSVISSRTSTHLTLGHVHSILTPSRRVASDLSICDNINRISSLASLARHEMTGDNDKS